MRGICRRLQILSRSLLIQCYMRISILILIISGLILGLYFTLQYQNRLREMGQTGTLIPIIGVLVGGVGASKIIYDWCKELSLKFDGTTSKDVHYLKGMDLVTKLYCLRVKKKGVGGAENSEGQIKVEGMDSDYYTTQWYKESNPSVLITMDEKYLQQLTKQVIS